MVRQICLVPIRKPLIGSPYSSSFELWTSRSKKFIWVLPESMQESFCWSSNFNQGSWESTVVLGRRRTSSGKGWQMLFESDICPRFCSDGRRSKFLKGGQRWTSRSRELWFRKLKFVENWSSFQSLWIHLRPLFKKFDRPPSKSDSKTLICIFTPKMSVLAKTRFGS